MRKHVHGCARRFVSTVPRNNSAGHTIFTSKMLAHFFPTLNATVHPCVSLSIFNTSSIVVLSANFYLTRFESYNPATKFKGNLKKKVKQDLNKMFHKKNLFMKER